MISLGVDIGGTGCKCVAFDAEGEQLAIAYREYPIPSGMVNLPAESLKTSVFQVISECARKLKREEIVSLTISSFGESFVAIDQNGQALSDILLYFADSANTSFSKLVERVGAERFMQIARIAPDPCYSLSKMLYTVENAPRPVRKYLFIASYICYLLTGEAVSDESLACRSLLYDVQRRAWSKELLEASSIESYQLPRVVPTGSIAGKILPEIARELGLSEDTRIVIGSHDQIVNALGAGVQAEGDAVDTSGTCECITPLFPAIPESLNFQRLNFACVPYLENLGYVTYAYNISAGSVVRWVRNALGAEFEAEAKARGMSVYDVLNEKSPEEPTELLILPYLQGMGGTPDVDPAATGLIAGLTTRTRLPEIYRAVLEGVTFEMRYNQEKLCESGVSVKRLMACGGGARSKVWLQIKADILGCEILPVLSEETGAMGSAILGFAAVTGEKPLAVAKRFWRYGELVHPNPEHKKIYDARYERFKCYRAFALKEKP